MKGNAILFVALHNFFHSSHLTEFVRENENTFDVQKTLDYFNVLKSFELSDIGQFFSFLGWIGVVVFMFISGYGLVKKYEGNGNQLKAGKYIFYSWKKLAVLLLMGVVYFVIIAVATGSGKIVIPRSLLQLTLLNNLLMPRLSIDPGVYWYFGLAFEFYLLYLLVRRWSARSLMIGAGCLLLIQIAAIIVWGPESEPWSWLRHNFMGWGQVFLTGMAVAKSNFEKHLPTKTLPLFLLAGLCLVSLPFLFLNVWTWFLIVPFVAVMFFVFLAGGVNNTKILKRIGLWLGKYSAFIFVVHPIVRSMIIILNKRVSLELWQMTAIYIFAVILGAFIYKPLYKWLMSIKMKPVS